MSLCHGYFCQCLPLYIYTDTLSSKTPHSGIKVDARWTSKKFQTKIILTKFYWNFTFQVFDIIHVHQFKNFIFRNGWSTNFLSRTKIENFLHIQKTRFYNHHPNAKTHNCLKISFDKMFVNSLSNLLYFSQKYSNAKI